jgi:hypothetical protein
MKSPAELLATAAIDALEEFIHNTASTLTLTIPSGGGIQLGLGIKFVVALCLAGSSSCKSDKNLSIEKFVESGL